jgi:hypothetical protein
MNTTCCQWRENDCTRYEKDRSDRCKGRHGGYETQGGGTELLRNAPNLWVIEKNSKPKNLAKKAEKMKKNKRNIRE